MAMGALKHTVAVAVIGLMSAVIQAGGESAAVEVEALLGNTAVLRINGERKTLRVGESFAEVTLVATQPTTATIEVAGRAQTIGLSQRVGTHFHESVEHVVTIPRDAMMQYQTNAAINGRSVQVMVDTGASMVAISSEQASAMNIDYSAGTPSQVETASGMSKAYAVTLASVSVGDIQVDNVPAVVVEGAYPGTILLGVSFLQHVKLQEHNGILSLSKSR